MSPLDQLSLVWQVWGAMLLGALLMMLAVVIGVEWLWIVSCARAAWQWLADVGRDLFTDGDAIDRELAQARDCCRQFVSPHPHEPIRSTARDADEILILSRGRGYVFSARDRVGTPVPVLLMPTKWDPDKVVLRIAPHDAPATPPFPFTPLVPHTDDAARRRQLLAFAQALPGRPVVH